VAARAVEAELPDVRRKDLVIAALRELVAISV
jgi:hypothetical protein